MREYNREYRQRDREYTRDFTEEYRENIEETIEREPHESLFNRPALVRVVLKKKYNDHEKNFKEMLQEFKRKISNIGIMHDFKDHQFYESKSVRKRKTRLVSAKKSLMDTIEKKIVAGDKDIKASPGLIKKVIANMKEKQEKKEKKDKKNNYQNKRQDD